MFTKPPPSTHHPCIYTVELRTHSIKMGERWSWGTAQALKVFQVANTLVYVLWKPLDTDQSLSIQASSLHFSLHVLPLSSYKPPDSCSLSRWQQAHEKTAAFAAWAATGKTHAGWAAYLETAPPQRKVLQLPSLSQLSQYPISTPKHVTENSDPFQTLSSHFWKIALQFLCNYLEKKKKGNKVNFLVL